MFKIKCKLCFTTQNSYVPKLGNTDIVPAFRIKSDNFQEKKVASFCFFFLVLFFGVLCFCSKASFKVVILYVPTYLPFSFKKF